MMLSSFIILSFLCLIGCPLLVRSQLLTLTYPAQPKFSCSWGSLSTHCYVNKSMTFYPSDGLVLVGCGSLTILPGVVLRCERRQNTSLASVPQTLSTITNPTCPIDIRMRGQIDVQGTIAAPNITLMASNVTVRSTGRIDTSGLGWGYVTVDVNLVGLGLLNLPLWTAPPPPSSGPSTSSAGVPALSLSSLVGSALTTLLGGLSCGGGGGGGHAGIGGAGKCCIGLNCLLGVVDHPGGVSVTTDSLYPFPYGPASSTNPTSIGYFTSHGGAGGAGVTGVALLCTATLLAKAGGAGGGSVIIDAYNNAVIDGVVTSAGGSVGTTSNTIGGPGGGGGGSIVINAPGAFSGSGLIDASGGAGTAPGGGGGGGGYIALLKNVALPAGMRVRVKGGFGGGGVNASVCSGGGTDGVFLQASPASCLPVLSTNYTEYSFPTCGSPDMVIKIPYTINDAALGVMVENLYSNSNNSFTIGMDNQTVLAEAKQSAANVQFYFSFDLISQEVVSVNKSSNRRAAATGLLSDVLALIDPKGIFQVRNASSKGVIDLVRALFFDVTQAVQYFSNGTLKLVSFTLPILDVLITMVVNTVDSLVPLLGSNLMPGGIKLEMAFNSLKGYNAESQLMLRYIVGTSGGIMNYSATAVSGNATEVLYVNITNADGWKFVVSFPAYVMINGTRGPDAEIYDVEYLNRTNSVPSDTQCGLSSLPYDEGLRITLAINLPKSNATTLPPITIDPNFGVLFGGGGNNNGGDGGDGGGDGGGGGGDGVAGDGDGIFKQTGAGDGLPTSGVIAISVILGVVGLLAVLGIVAIFGVLAYKAYVKKRDARVESTGEINF